MDYTYRRLCCETKKVWQTLSNSVESLITNYNLLSRQQFTLYFHIGVLGAFRVGAKVVSHNFSTA